MENGSPCHRHRDAEASFTCHSCGNSFCSRCCCELLDGSVCCTECAVERAGESGGVFEPGQGSAAVGESRAGRPTSRMRLITVVLLVCIPLLALEGLFLLRSRVSPAGAKDETHHVMSDTLVLITVLNTYRHDTGAYPEELEEIVPSHWKPGDRAELERYEYHRSAAQRYVLQPRLTGEITEDASIKRARSLIPRVLGPESRLDVFLAAGTGTGVDQPVEGAP